MEKDPKDPVDGTDIKPEILAVSALQEFMLEIQERVQKALSIARIYTEKLTINGKRIINIKPVVGKDEIMFGEGRVVVIGEDSDGNECILKFVIEGDRSFYALADNRVAPDFTILRYNFAYEKDKWQLIWRRTCREFEILKAIAPINGIPQAYEKGTVETANGKMHYIATEFFNGRTLANYMQELVFGEIMNVICSLLSILESVHNKGYIHGDVSPENILVSADYQKCKLLDFGGAQRIGDQFRPPFLFPEPEQLELHFPMSREEAERGLWELIARGMTESQILESEFKESTKMEMLKIKRRMAENAKKTKEKEPERQQVIENLQGRQEEEQPELIIKGTGIYIPPEYSEWTDAFSHLDIRDEFIWPMNVDKRTKDYTYYYMLFLNHFYPFGVTNSPTRDLYAVGILLYQLLTNRSETILTRTSETTRLAGVGYGTARKKKLEDICKGTNYEKLELLSPQVRSQLSQIIRKATELKCRERYQSAAEMLADIKKIQQEIA